MGPVAKIQQAPDIDRTIRINSLLIHARKRGSGPAILLLHGWGQSVEFWVGFKENLGKKFTLWSLDLPGFGHSQEPGSVWRPQDYADFVHSFVSLMQIKNPIIVGHSFGGRVASCYAAKYRCKKLVLYSASGLTGGFMPLKSLHTVGLRYLKSLCPEFIYRWHSKIFLPKGLKNKTLVTRGRALRMLDIYLAIQSVSLENVYSKILAPTLLIYGGKDYIVPLEIGKKIRSKIAESRLVVIPEATHFAHLEKPETFFTYLSAFLSD